MNERIKQLAAQANVKPLYSQQGFDPRYIFEQEQLEKFAQLIVAECAKVVEDAVDHREPASTYVSKIQKHFGVE